MACAFESVFASYVPVVTTRPYSVGFWLYLTAASNGFLWSSGNSSTTNNFIALRIATSAWRISVADAGTSDNTDAGTAVAGVWNYVLFRAIGSGNTRADILSPTELRSIQNTSTRTPTTPNRYGLMANMESGGTTYPGPAYVGEFFWTATDVCADGAAASLPFMRQLAYRGPFSIPRIAADIIAYRSFRNHALTVEGGVDDETFNRGTREWTVSSGTPRLAPHPPLPPDYLRPADTLSLQLV